MTTDQTDPTTLDWKAAHQHLLATMSHYFDLLGQPGVNVHLALQFTFFPLINRYVAGERTPTLHAEMMDLQ